MPIANPNGLNHNKGTIKPADTLEIIICTKVCAEAAVPRIRACLSKAARESTGIANAIPMLNKATGAIKNKAGKVRWVCHTYSVNKPLKLTITAIHRYAACNTC